MLAAAAVSSCSEAGTIIDEHYDCRQAAQHCNWNPAKPGSLEIKVGKAAAHPHEELVTILTRN